MGYFNGSEPINIDWVKMSRTLADLPRSMMDYGQAVYSHFSQYDYSQWTTLTLGKMSNNGTRFTYTMLRLVLSPPFRVSV